ncbi:hypothetical protein QBC44DRAFT_332680 [Cladorrhinum sp. PSN332]|nr:hypothetical protein QBC44DRAFT_332680 [Cladorrhinum sp. PSN332]
MPFLSFVHPFSLFCSHLFYPKLRVGGLYRERVCVCVCGCVCPSSFFLTKYSISLPLDLGFLFLRPDAYVCFVLCVQFCFGQDVIYHTKKKWLLPIVSFCFGSLLLFRLIV